MEESFSFLKQISFLFRDIQDLNAAIKEQQDLQNESRGVTIHEGSQLYNLCKCEFAKAIKSSS
jgi:hypothetical protein